MIESGEFEMSYSQWYSTRWRTDRYGCSLPWYYRWCERIRFFSSHQHSMISIRLSRSLQYHIHFKLWGDCGPRSIHCIWHFVERCLWARPGVLTEIYCYSARKIKIKKFQDIFSIGECQWYVEDTREGYSRTQQGLRWNSCRRTWYGLTLYRIIFFR